jgi:hypothetical protein
MFLTSVFLGVAKKMPYYKTHFICSQMVSWGDVRLCQSSWCDPAMRSHVGSLGGAVWLTVLALFPLQLLAVCHTGDRIPDRSTWDLQRRINILGLRKGARGREDCFLFPIVRL